MCLAGFAENGRSRPPYRGKYGEYKKKGAERSLTQAGAGWDNLPAICIHRAVNQLYGRAAGGGAKGYGLFRQPAGTVLYSAWINGCSLCSPCFCAISQARKARYDWRNGPAVRPEPGSNGNIYKIVDVLHCGGINWCWKLHQHHSGALHHWGMVSSAPGAGAGNCPVSLRCGRGAVQSGLRMDSRALWMAYRCKRSGYNRVPAHSYTLYFPGSSSRIV